MSQATPKSGGLRRFFGALVERAFFEELGIADVRLTEYLSDLLCRFVRMDAVFGLRDVHGRRIEEVAEMLAEAERRPRRSADAAPSDLPDLALPAASDGGASGAPVVGDASGNSVHRPPRERIVHKHVGDFVLFWTGVYPEFLSRLRAPGRKDRLIDYLAQGRRSYYIASTYDEPALRDETRTLRRLSEELEVCAFGLNMVRRSWEQLAPQQHRRLREKW